MVMAHVEVRTRVISKNRCALVSKYAEGVLKRVLMKREVEEETVGYKNMN